MNTSFRSSALHKFLTSLAIAVSVLSLLPVLPAQAAHVFDNKVRFTGATDPLTQSYTVGSGGTLLVVSIVTEGNAVRTGGAPTFNGVALTQADIAQTPVGAGAPESTTELWYLLNPPTVSAYTLSIPNTTGPRTLYVIASSYSAQSGFTSAFDVAGGNAALTANPSVSVVTSANGDVIVGAMGNGNNNAPSGRSGTSLYETDNGGFSDNGQYYLQTTTGSYAMGWTITANDWGVVVAAFKETAINDAPTFTKGANLTVNEDAGAQTVAGWATGMDDGDPELIQALTFNVTGNTNAGLFSAGPAIDATTGNLTYTPTANANGSATITITLSDNGSNTPPNVNTSASQSFVINVAAVNDAPSFTKGADQTVNEDAGAQTVAGWATAINDGDPELTQTLTFNVTGNTNPGLFSAGPAIDATTGDLTYTPAANANGSATITITLSDNGSNTPPDVNSSASQPFVINLNPVNDAPSFTASNPPPVPVNAGAQTVNSWAIFNPGPNEAGQNVLQYSISGSTCGTLLSAGPSVSTAGTLTYTPATNQTGNCTFTVTVQDDGGTANGGVDTSSPAQTFTISVAVPLITLSPATLPDGTLSFASSQTITASGGTGPYTFAVTGGAQPTGLTLSSAGLLSGTPTALGTFNFTITATDSSGGSGPFTGSQAYSITINNGMAVTINQDAGQADPTNTSPINFTVVFSAATTNFATGDVTLGGTAGATTATVTEVAPNDGTTYNVAVSGMTSKGTVMATIAAGVATDAASNPNNASTSTDNVVTYDSGNPSVISTNLTASYTGTGPGSFVVTFSEAVDDPAGNTGTDDVTNIANYLLVNKGTNGIANTVSCAGGVAADDTNVTVTSVVYNNATFQSTVTLASPLPVGSYRLFICGTTSIVDLSGNPLNGGTDYTFDFVVQAAATQSVSGSLPATGFPMHEVTSLPFQPANLAYASYSDLWLEIPSLGVKMSIVGVPSTKEGWNVTWLNKNAGWLNGSAYPTWNGNSVLTGHVWDALNQPGPFANLKNLKYGDQIKIHAFGQVYIYEVRESRTVLPTSISAVFKHEEKSWITLLTCEDYKETSQSYSYRRMIRAVLISVISE